jgi:alpha-galactosidase
MRRSQEKYDYMSYRQDLKGYGEPAEGLWDGYQRINTDSKSGGIAGIFRQGSPESSRVVTVNYLDRDAVYEVRKAPGGEFVTKSKGSELSEKGFNVILPKKYDGAVFEIIKVGN